MSRIIIYMQVWHPFPWRLRWGSDTMEIQPRPQSSPANLDVTSPAKLVRFQSSSAHSHSAVWPGDEADGNTIQCSVIRARIVFCTWYIILLPDNGSAHHLLTNVIFATYFSKGKKDSWSSQYWRYYSKLSTLLPLIQLFPWIIIL